MSKVFIVTQGEYSSYQIVGVYSSRERAEEAVRFWNRADIEEHKLNVLPDHPPGMYPYCLEMRKDGDVLKVFHCEHNTYYPAYPWMDAPVETWRFHVWARNEEHAIKIANERRVWIISENLWFPRRFCPAAIDEARLERIRQMWGDA